MEKPIVILYHKSCMDGFGGAYAAWKRFGNNAEYIPVGYGDPVVEGLDGKEVFLVDFCYELPGEIERLTKITKRLVILDHHRSSKERVESIPEHVFDENRSGATIAWSFFNPGEPTPRLLSYIEDNDLYRHALPESQAFRVFISIQPHDFLLWEQLASEMENEAERDEIIKTARLYSDYYNALARQSIDSAKKVRFEGYTCYFATTHPVFRSDVGHALAEKLPPIALVVTAHPDGFGVSIRGDGSVNVADIAKKYNGGGHPSASGFFIRNGTEMPWIEVEE